MEHTVKAFDAELRKLHDALNRMGQLARDQFTRAIQALSTGDTELAAQVVRGDDEIDQLDQGINNQVVRLLALQQPVADDLRVTITALKISSALERVGDYASSIAKRTAALKELPPLGSLKTVKRMGELVVRLLADVMDAYETADVAKARAVWARDREVDELHSALFREMLTYMMEDPRHIAACTHLLFVAKNVERAGDHATTIGEMVCFMVEGRPLSGERPKGPSTSMIGPEEPPQAPAE